MGHWHLSSCTADEARHACVAAGMPVHWHPCRLPVCLHRQHRQDIGHRHSHDGLSEEPDEAPLQEAGGSCISKGWCMLHMCSCTAGSPLHPRPCNALPCPVDNPLLAFQYAVLGMGMEDER